MKNSSFDEKQMVDRGRAFQYGYLSALIIAFLIFFIDNVFGLKTSSYSIFAFQIGTPVAVCLIACIVKDVINGISKHSGKLVSFFYGFVGLILLIMSIFRLAVEQEMLIQNGIITDLSGNLYISFCIIITVVVYIIKCIKNNKQFKEE